MNFKGDRTWQFSTFLFPLERVTNQWYSYLCTTQYLFHNCLTIASIFKPASKNGQKHNFATQAPKRQTCRHHWQTIGANKQTSHRSIEKCWLRIRLDRVRVPEANGFYKPSGNSNMDCLI